MKTRDPEIRIPHQKIGYIGKFWGLTMKTGRWRPRTWSAADPFLPLVAALLGPAEFRRTIATERLDLGGPASGSTHPPRYPEHGFAITFS